MNEYRQAIGQYRKQLHIARRSGSVQGEGWAYGSIGFAFLDTEPPKPQYARRHLERWLHITRKLHDGIDECNALGGLGLAYHKLGEHQKAIEHCRESIRIARDLGYRRGEGAALGYLGQATVALGRTAEGIEYYKEQIEICRAIPDPEGEAYASRHLAEAYISIGETQSAIHSLEVTLAYEIRIDHPFAERTRLRLHTLRERLNLPSSAVM